jgi:hypothetical protein
MSDKHVVTQEEFDQGTPILMVLRRPNGEGLLTAMDISAFDSPSAWGIVIADLVQHVANAYAQEGMHGGATHGAVREIVLKELSAPTEKVTSARWSPGES